MHPLSLDVLVRDLLGQAADAAAGHTADTVVGGDEQVLHQTVIAMVEGAVLGEHKNPGEAAVQVLSGEVRLVASHEVWTGRTGDLIVVPIVRHRVEAVADSAVLLTVAKVA
jgi:quercetin dioxygenase-like cupin family protein